MVANMLVGFESLIVFIIGLTIISFVLAIVNLFFGYRLFRWQMAIAGFVIGLFMGPAILIPAMIGPVTLVVGIPFGLLIGFLSYKFYKIFLFIYSTSFSFAYLSVKLYFSQILNPDVVPLFAVGPEDFSISFVLMIALTIGVLIISFSRVSLIIGTSLVSSLRISTLSSTIISSLIPLINFWLIYFIIVAMLFAIGVTFQFKNSYDLDIV